MREFLNIDCMDAERGLPSFPDKYFDLAIVDPPYGKVNIMNGGGRSSLSWKVFDRKNWDLIPPIKEYWTELFRISKDQIIWGGNYFTEYLPAKMGWIIWDKMRDSFSAGGGELAFSSFDCKLRFFRRLVQEDKGFRNMEGGDIHPTQKPVALYRWLLENYAKPGDLILDTHVGSASSLIACEALGFDYVGYEIDADYYQAAKKRIEKWRSLPLFDEPKKEADQLGLAI